jgi:SAM-dependent methyltransferase
LLSEEHHVVSLDSSGAMLRHFRLNYPAMPAVQATVQSCPFIDSIFDAAVAWGIMFHLNPEDQIRAIANISRVLKPGAPFLFTSGDEDCFHGKVSTMNGVEFLHFSYSIDTYGRVLRDHGFALANVHADSGNNTYYLAKKADSPS